MDTLDTLSAARLYHALTAECTDLARTDGSLWLRFVRTRDEADPDRSVKPFPVHLEYVTALWNILTTYPWSVIAKSRQMLVSWIVCAFCVHWARTKPHQAVYWQTQQWRDAIGMVSMPEGGFLGRCDFIEQHLPEWMKVPYKSVEGCLTYENGSIIQALAGGADQIRGKVASIIVEDEFAKQAEAAGVYTAVAPLVQKGARLIVISTPNGMNTFATLYHGRDMAIAA